MPECQSSHKNSLPPEASPEQVLQIKRACEWDKIILGESAQVHVIYWRIGLTGMRHIITEHIEKRRKIFKKPDPNDPGKLLERNLQANISIYDGKDVYVEMIMTDGVKVIINAHEHSTGRRLPQ